MRLCALAALMAEGFVIFRFDLVGGRKNFFINSRTIFGTIVRSNFVVEGRGRGKHVSDSDTVCD